MAADDKFCIAFFCLKNWATYAFVKLMSGVLSYNSGKDEFMGGCIIFLQLYYFDVVGDRHPGVKKNVTPIMAWGDSQATELVARLEEEGHLKSPTMIRTRANEHAECGTLKDGDRQYIGATARKGVHNDGFDDNNKVGNVNSRLDKLEEGINVIQPFLVEFRKRADSFEGLVANFKGEVVHLMVAEILRHVNPATKTPIGHMDKVVQYPEYEGTKNPINSQDIEDINCVEGGYNDIASQLFGMETTIKSSTTQLYFVTNVYDVVVIPARMVSKTSEPGIRSTVSARSQTHWETRGKKGRESKTTVARHHLRDISNFYESNVDNKRLKVVRGNTTKYVIASPYKLRHAISYKDEQLVNFIFLRGNTNLSNMSTTEKRLVCIL
ncbi:hypothetical protein M0R45_030708 [Rubus argutus]|uniref:Uncharacterized protein n=1 Tax=Rubus argutus TaxID=59490 RepID=A0AAW1WDX0_RUBAR